MSVADGQKLESLEKATDCMFLSMSAELDLVNDEDENEAHHRLSVRSSSLPDGIKNTMPVLPHQSSQWSWSAKMYFKQMKPWDMFKIQIKDMNNHKFKELWREAAALCDIPEAQGKYLLELEFLHGHYKMTKKMQEEPEMSECEEIEYLHYYLNNLKAEHLYTLRADKQQSVLDVASAIQSAAHYISCVKRLTTSGNATTRVSQTQDRGDPLEAEVERVAFNLLHLFAQRWCTSEVYDAVLYPIQGGYGKSDVVCKPDISMEAHCVFNDKTQKKCLTSRSVLLLAELKKDSKFHADEEIECLKHCHDGVNEHFSQLLVGLKGSLFAQDWSTSEIVNGTIRTQHSKICSIFGMMQHGTMLQFTCLRLTKAHMENVVRRKKREAIKFNMENSSLTSSKGGIRDPSEMKDFQGDFFVSERPFDLAVVDDLMEVKKIIGSLAAYQYYPM